ncbi:MAG: hypothetical protein R3F40_16880 [Candidatus Competibacteraceae bacterium]
MLQLIEQQKYFVLHAPRQTGKTSVLLALMALLNRGERYRCLYANIEGAQAYRGNVDAALRTVVMQLATAAEVYLGDRRVKDWALEAVREQSGGGMLAATLTRWSLESDLPIVLLLDEVDTLVGDALISLLRQIRAGYTQRPRVPANHRPMRRARRTRLPHAQRRPGSHHRRLRLQHQSRIAAPG